MNGTCLLPAATLHHPLVVAHCYSALCPKRHILTDGNLNPNLMRCPITPVSLLRISKVNHLTHPAIVVAQPTTTQQSIHHMCHTWQICRIKATHCSRCWTSQASSRLLSVLPQRSFLSHISLSRSHSSLPSPASPPSLFPTVSPIYDGSLAAHLSSSR